MHTKRLLLSLLLASATPVRAADCLTIGVPAGAGAGGEIMDIVGKMTAKAGLCVKRLRAPHNRLLELPIDGEADAVIEPASRFVAVPTPLFAFSATLYWPAGRPEPSGPAAAIGVVLGQDWAHHAALGFGSSGFEVRENKQLFEMMVSGRLDGMIVPAQSFQHFLPQFPTLRKLQSRHLYDVPVRLMLDPRFADDLPKLDRALIELQKEGYVDAVLKSYTR